MEKTMEHYHYLKVLGMAILVWLFDVQAYACHYVAVNFIGWIHVIMKLLENANHVGGFILTILGIMKFVSPQFRVREFLRNLWNKIKRYGRK